MPSPSSQSHVRRVPGYTPTSAVMSASGRTPEDGRHGRASGFDRYLDEIEEKAALPGVTAKGIHELLLERHAGDEPSVPRPTARLRTNRGRAG